MSLTDLVALLTGCAGLVTAAGGILLAIRAVRDKERKAAKDELKNVEEMLTNERKDRIDAELQIHRLTLLLAQHGIDPEIPPDA